MEFGIMRNKVLLVVFLLIIINFQSFSQETGSFNRTIKFNGFDRTLSLYVPEEYTGEKPFNLMICLHPNGDSSSHYRYQLIDYNRWNSFVEETIFVFPDGGDDENSDFYIPKGDEEIIMRAVNFAKQLYKIDTNRIYLQGFLDGGRTALKYSLDKPDKFFGVLLNHPTIRGLEDAKNNPLHSSIYNYQNASKLNIVVLYAGGQPSESNSIKVVFDSLVENNSKARLSSYTTEAIESLTNFNVESSMKFLNNVNVNKFELSSYRLSCPTKVCDSLFSFKLRVLNQGSEIINSFTINFIAGGEWVNHKWQGTILPYHHEDVIISDIPLNKGGNFFNISTMKLNEVENNKSKNNSNIVIVEYFEKGLELPIIEEIESLNFGNSSGFWKVSNSYNYPTWQIDTTTGKDGKISIRCYNSKQFYYNIGYAEELMSPVINLSGTDYIPTLKFDVAYNYHKYTPPITTYNEIFTDTLEILISTDCGETFKTIYKKYGAELATSAEPILNPSSIKQSIFVPKPDEWRNELINLAEYSQAKNAVFKFNYISGMGGSIYIDNIIIGDEELNISETTDTKISLAPNPANEYVNIYLGSIDEESVDLIITDILGNEVKALKNINLKSDNEQVRINTADMNPGFYLLNIKGKFGNRIEKLIIR